ncbi:MAG: ribosomal protein L7/L12 [Anaerolineales bacterium]|nr:ribosomal protein L7/L12 [Anaerolineales bacterium]
MKKIAAIKAYRSVSGTGLKEAKDYVDRVESGMYAAGELTVNPNRERIIGIRGY